MKKVLSVFCLLLVLSFSACGTKMVTMAPQEVKVMTTNQYAANKEDVFRSAISLIQSESFLIENADKEIGLIRANKRIENKNTWNQRFLLGVSHDANTSKISIYIDEFNANLTEVKITLYNGSESTRRDNEGGLSTDVKERMVYDPEVYEQWFHNLQAEIERRKALSQ